MGPVRCREPATCEPARLSLLVSSSPFQVVFSSRSAILDLGSRPRRSDSAGLSQRSLLALCTHAWLIELSELPRWCAIHAGSRSRLGVELPLTSVLRVRLESRCTTEMRDVERERRCAPAPSSAEIEGVSAGDALPEPPVASFSGRVRAKLDDRRPRSVCWNCSSTFARSKLGAAGDWLAVSAKLEFDLDAELAQARRSAKTLAAPSAAPAAVAIDVE